MPEPTQPMTLDPKALEAAAKLVCSRICAKCRGERQCDEWEAWAKEIAPEIRLYLEAAGLVEGPVIKGSGE